LRATGDNLIKHPAHGSRTPHSIPNLVDRLAFMERFCLTFHAVQLEFVYVPAQQQLIKARQSSIPRGNRQYPIIQFSSDNWPLSRAERQVLPSQ